jgi:hypothetical protein
VRTVHRRRGVSTDAPTMNSSYVNETTPIVVGGVVGDYVALGLFVVPSLTTVVALSTLAALLYTRYPPLMARNIPNIVPFAVAAFVQSVATLVVAFRHVWPAVYDVAPLLWTPWLECFAGLGVAAAMLALRLVSYGVLFQQRLRRLSPVQKRAFRIGVFATMLVPPLLISVVGSFRPELLESSPSTPLVHGFVRPTWYTWVWFAWLLVACCGACVGAVLVVRHRRRRQRHQRQHATAIAGAGPFDEAPALRDSMLIAALALLVSAALRSVPDYEDRAPIRDAVACITAVAYALIVVRYIGRDVWRALRRDREYAERFKQRYLRATTHIADELAEYPSTQALIADGFVYSAFLQYARSSSRHRVATRDEGVAEAIHALRLLRQRHRHPSRRLVDGREIARTLGAMVAPQRPPPPKWSTSWAVRDSDLERGDAVFDGVDVHLVTWLRALLWDDFAAYYSTFVGQWKLAEDERRRELVQNNLLTPFDDSSGAWHLLDQTPSTRADSAVKNDFFDQLTASLRQRTHTVAEVDSDIDADPIE